MATKTRPVIPMGVHRLAERLKPAVSPIRLNVLRLLGDGERSVGTLRAGIVCDSSLFSRHLSQHLTRLRLADLVASRPAGNRRIYALTSEGRDLLRIVELLVDGQDAERPTASPLNRHRR